MKINWKSEIRLTVICLSSIGTTLLVLTQLANKKEESAVQIVETVEIPNAKLSKIRDEYVYVRITNDQKYRLNSLRAPSELISTPPLPTTPIIVRGKIIDIDKCSSGTHFMKLSCQLDNETIKICCFVSNPDVVYNYSNGETVSLSGTVKEAHFLSDDLFVLEQCKVVNNNL
jgi:hypothetical protein